MPANPALSFNHARYETASQYIATTTTYDALGRVASTTNPSRPGDGLNYATTYGYDALGRVTSVKTADGAQAISSYWGNAVTVADQDQKSRWLKKDALGRLVTVVEDPNGAGYTTTYGYDPLGNLRGVNQSGRTRTFVYDSLSRLLGATNPESGSVWYSYDAAGNLFQKADVRGITTTYSYDALNRITGKTYTDGTPAVTFVYDANWVPNSLGRLVQAGDIYSSTYFTQYDAVGRAKASEQVIAGSVYHFYYDYNLAGALVKETYPSGRQVSMAYDGATELLPLQACWEARVRLMWDRPPMHLKELR